LLPSCSCLLWPVRAGRLSAGCSSVQLVQLHAYQYMHPSCTGLPHLINSANRLPAPHRAAQDAALQSSPLAAQSTGSPAQSAHLLLRSPAPVSPSARPSLARWAWHRYSYSYNARARAALRCVPRWWALRSGIAPASPSPPSLNNKRLHSTARPASVHARRAAPPTGSGRANNKLGGFEPLNIAGCSPPCAADSSSLRSLRSAGCNIGASPHHETAIISLGHPSKVPHARTAAQP
jgi:hypothetical protein